MIKISFLIAVLFTTIYTGHSQIVLDSTYGVNGKYQHFGQYNETNTLIQYPDGSWLAGGYGNLFNQGDHFLFFKSLENGSVDTSFGNSLGYVVRKFPSSLQTVFGECYDIALQSTGKIIAAGKAWSGGSSPTNKLSMMRLFPDGSIDSTFGVNGLVLSLTNPTSTGGYGIKAIDIQTDDKILAAGNTYYNQGNIPLLRYTANGNLDSTFDNDGIVWVNANQGFSGAPYFYEVKVQADGKIVVAVDAYQNSHYNTILFRYNTNGAIDSTFGVNGKVQIIKNDQSLNQKMPLLIQPDQKILTASRGASILDTCRFFRLNTDGSFDTTFNHSGISPVSMPGFFFANIQCATLQPDGKILYGIYGTDTTSGYQTIFGRLNADGTMDTTFGNNGIVSGAYFIGVADEDIWDIALQHNGKLLILSNHVGVTGILRFLTDITLGKLEFSQRMVVNCYPNPVSNHLHLQFEIGRDYPLQFSIYSIDGSLMSQRNPKIYMAGTVDEQIDVTTLTPGIYFLKINNGNGSETVRFIRN